MSRSTAEKFVDRVYQRLLIYRTLEQFGWGILLASVLETVLNLLAIWQSIPTWPILLFSACVGSVVGVALTIYRWPTWFSAVTQADRQLQFDDLLTSAIYSTPNQTDDFSNIVQAMADAKCRQHSPREVSLHQLSTRTWSAIGLTLSVAITLAVIPFGAVKSQAIDVNSAVLLDTPQPSAEIATAKAPPQINHPLDETAWNPITEEQNRVDGHRPSADASQKNPDNTSASGGGSSTVAPPTHQHVPDRQSIGTQNAGINAASGGGDSHDFGQRGEKANGQQSATNTPQNQTPKWNGHSPNKNTGGSAMPLNDQIPPEDRELIREFFNR